LRAKNNINIANADMKRSASLLAIELTLYIPYGVDWHNSLH